MATSRADEAPSGVDPLRGIRRARSGAWRWATLLAPGVLLLVLWELGSGPLIREVYVSKPSEVGERLVELFSTGEIFPHLLTTGQELAWGYTIGVLAGVIGGYALGRSPALTRVFEPYIIAFYGVPKIALAPLFIIWFGIGIVSKIALAAIMVFFLVFFNVFMGVRSVDHELVNTARVMGASQRQLTRHVYLPGTMPYIIMGMRAAIPYAVIGVIVGEFTSAQQGLGLYMQRASTTFDPAGVFAGIGILLVFIVFANWLLHRLEGRVLRWRPSSGVQSGEAV